jgi:hypothetical protein
MYAVTLPQSRCAVPVGGGRARVVARGERFNVLALAVAARAVREPLDADQALVTRRARALGKLVCRADCEVLLHDHRVLEACGVPFEAEHIPHHHHVHVLVELLGIEVFGMLPPVIALSANACGGGGV